MSKKYQKAIDEYELEFDDTAPVWLIEEEDAVTALGNAVASGEPIRAARVPDDILT